MDKHKKFKEFGLSSWSIDNRITVAVLTILIVILGFWSYQSLPKENFPEVQIPTFYVGTVYPGTSPEDIENLITREIEKEMKSINGVKKITSNSKQDYSVVIIEFESTADLDEAMTDVKDAVDRAKSELPTDLPSDPLVQDINVAEFPIMFINLYGELDLVTIKRFADDLKDDVESLTEISRVEIVGALEREIQINLDLFKAQAAGVTFYDVQSAVSGENVIISGGELDIDGMKRALRVNGEFDNIEQIKNIVVGSGRGNKVFLKDIATVVDGFEDRESYARLDGLPVITLNVVKKPGENLVDASDEIQKIIAEYQKEKFPTNLKVNISGDQSYMTKSMLNELTNTIIIGFILVTVVLMFFMGFRDSMFVGLSVPLASLIAFVVLPWIGFTLNLVVLFTFIFAMGIVVDNAIVVIENTFRIVNEEQLPIVQAAKKAAGEVIAPVFSGTLTTMAPFIPLMFWEGTIGEFMFFLPVTIIITLFASLIVAYLINPVFAVFFMKKKEDEKDLTLKRFAIILGVMVALAILGYIAGSKTTGNVFIIAAILFLIYRFLLSPAINWFQKKAIPAMMERYKKILAWSLDHPISIITGTIAVIVGSLFIVSALPPKTIFFPDTEPNFVYVYNTFPTGTSVQRTDSVTKKIEAKVFDVIGRDNPAVKSVITNVAIGAGDPRENDRSASPHKSKVQVEFVPFKERGEVSSREYLETIRKEVKDIPGVQVVVDKDQGGPPTAPPVNIEVTGENFEELIEVASKLKAYLLTKNISGVEELKWDLELHKPELIVNVDRVKASELGISTAQIGMALRTSIFGTEVSKYRELEDEYPIQLRVDPKYRNDINALMNQKLIYRNMANGRIYEVPISAVASYEYTETYGGINRLDLEKVVTIKSNVTSDYNPNEVVAEVVKHMEDWKSNHETPGVDIEMTGETQEQEETAAFLGSAMLIAVMLIFLILMAQFNSIPKVFIIFLQVVLSMVGVFLGFSLTRMDFSIVMGGVGIVSLAGIVVNNGIILIDFMDIMRKRGMDLKEAVIEGGRVRFTPVLLTASSTVLGLLPLALSLNINFATLFTSFNPQIFLGGDNAAFWGPLSWTVIFGLTFATVVTLVVVPVLYYLTEKGLIRFKKWWNDEPEETPKPVDPDFNFTEN